jgi:hypothetical protein
VTRKPARATQGRTRLRARLAASSPAAECPDMDSYRRHSTQRGHHAERRFPVQDAPRLNGYAERLSFRSAQAVGECVPESGLVGMQGQGRPHCLLRVFARGKAGGDDRRRLVGEARRRPGKEPEESDSVLS